MSDPKAPNIDNRDTPAWGLYQRENFWKPNDGQVPPFNTGEEPNRFYAVSLANSPYRSGQA